MKVGFSLSRCMRDIYEGKVAIDDVLVIVARTDINPGNDEHWLELWEGYRQRRGWSNPEWGNIPDEAEQEMRMIMQDLFDQGKLHQPRQFNAYPPRLPYCWLETFAPEEEIASNPTVLKAWEKYKTLAGLSR